jgi:ankyrin repeat protein
VFTIVHLRAINRSFKKKGLCLLLLDKWKGTALYRAERYGHLSVVKLLAEGGAEVIVRNDDGKTVMGGMWRWETDHVIGRLDCVKFHFWMTEVNIHTEHATSLHLSHCAFVHCTIRSTQTAVFPNRV